MNADHNSVYFCAEIVKCSILESKNTKMNIQTNLHCYQSVHFIFDQKGQNIK